VERVTRGQAIESLRARLTAFVDDEHSLCEVAARLGVFCGGFAQFTFLDLKRRYPMIVHSRPRITPAELKELANRWQIARQQSLHTDLACDTQVREHHLRTCKGWDEWSEADLARFVLDLCGEEVEVVPDAFAAGAE